MTVQITKRHLDFVEEARKAFEESPRLESYRSSDESLLALRMGAYRDCIDVYNLDGGVANFVQQLPPMPAPRKMIHDFSLLMEHQFPKMFSIENKELGVLEEVSGFLISELNKRDKDKFAITRYCTMIANCAMMIADNEGSQEL
ncbi:hypothetical protein A374_08944 [Fictibacillus macauensis ZFHKF-1]|uniref:Uncharacterized protein n=1 Tax=Fictibacillus macauensis ZFHKF-1 TaxID=1196324 RepID=I8UGF8_9BACL|nr:hypothetical protein [Fictibacillus macauensis]EIT85950.1 hypothetical protein A374_08944 [Fictibacillus macauensis ZFHKF-1]